MSSEGGASEPFVDPTPEAWVEAARKALKGRDPSTLALRTAEGVVIPVLAGPAPARTDLGEVDTSPWRRGDGGVARRAQGWTVGAWLDTGSLTSDLHLAEAAVAGGATLLMWEVPHPAPEALAALRAVVGEAVRVIPTGPEAAALPEGARPRFTVDTLPVAEAGGSGVDELVALLASGAALLRRLQAEGRSTEALAGGVLLRVAVQRDTFVEIARLRAVRWLWARLITSAGGSGASCRAEVLAVASRATFTVADPWLNVLRGAHAAFVGAVAGADAIVMPAWDRTLGAPEAAAVRLSVTSQAVLREESWLAAVADPAGGSWAVEQLTEELARAAWEGFRAIEAAGGLEAGGEAALHARIAASAAQRAAEVATRRQGIVGVSLFPNPEEHRPQRAEAPLKVVREAAPWEALRARTEAAPQRPRALLALLGDAARWRAREAFCRPILEAAAFEVLSVPAEHLQERVGEAPCGVVLCGHDEDYPSLLPAALRASAGARFVVLAGRPGEHEATWRAQGLTGALAAGANLVAQLEALLAASGVPA